MPIHPLSNQSDALRRLFDSHSVESAYVFGSVAKNTASENSDVDFLVFFKENVKGLAKGELWWSLYDALRDLFNREIDLLTGDSLKNPYFISEIKKNLILIYGRPSEKVSV